MMISMRRTAALLLTLTLTASTNASDPPRSFSGIYPHLAMFNNQGECGTGAVVPWAGKLWVVTYSPHEPRGSDDQLYEITPDLMQTIRPESIGGTPANRMIHEESQQLFIGPYVIDNAGKVRVIPYKNMFGRPTGNARHLTDPANFVYSASMEEALYEINVKTLEVNELFADEAVRAGRHSDLPGYHGKGLASGFGRVIYANNGEHGKLAQERPDISSGVLAEWDGKSSEWKIVSRTQFTEVTTPDGIHGNLHPDKNPVWAMGWDHRSLILMCLDGEKWHRYRLTKASHSYDGAHGWNTEWPRIRDIGEDDLLMTMHGAFWKFPREFQPGKTAGIRPRSSYLKIVGDFCRWNDMVILGCDDSAKNEFLNTRKAKGKLAGPEQSQSNLLFLLPEKLDDFGRMIGHGSVWINDEVTANSPSDPMHVGGFGSASLYIAHQSDSPVTFQVEIDATGNDRWTPTSELTIQPGPGELHSIKLQKAEWLRLVPRSDVNATASFELRTNAVTHQEETSLTQSLADPTDAEFNGGLVRAGKKTVGLQMLATKQHAGVSTPVGYYELTPDLQFQKKGDPEKIAFMETEVALKKDVLTIDGSSILFVDGNGLRYRLPIGNPWFLQNPTAINSQRIAREICTERDLFQVAGTFFELPARNAGGMQKIRPVSTHDHFIHDYCSWRGLMVLTGIKPDAAKNDPHVLVSDDGNAAVWLGSVDDLWHFGSPKGQGGPWTKSAVAAGETSDPYLVTGYGKKSLRAESSQPTTLTLECDFQGNGTWTSIGELKLAEDTSSHQLTMNGTSEPVKSDASSKIHLPDALNAAYWVRFTSAQPSTITVELTYE